MHKQRVQEMLYRPIERLRSAPEGQEDRLEGCAYVVVGLVNLLWEGRESLM